MVWPLVLSNVENHAKSWNSGTTDTGVLWRDASDKIWCCLTRSNHPPTLNSLVPCTSARQELLDELNLTALHVTHARDQNRDTLLQISADSENDLDDSDLDTDGDCDSQDDILAPIIISPPSPILPLIFLDIFDSESELDSQDSDAMDIGDKPYCHLLGGIMALINEVEKAWFLNHLDVPLLHVPQLHLLEHFAVFWPHLFHEKLHVNPVIFNCIVNKICEDNIFHSRSNNLWLPVLIQLAIFLNHVGHYRNAISPEDVLQWAGVSMGSVVNCTHCVMIVLLGLHNEYIWVLSLDSESDNMELSHKFVEKRTCPGWQNGVFAADGSSILLFQKPGYFGKTFYNRKSTYCYDSIPG